MAKSEASLLAAAKARGLKTSDLFLWQAAAAAVLECRLVENQPLTSSDEDSDAPSEGSDASSEGSDASSELAVPDPIGYCRIWLSDLDFTGIQINYTDCMESSVLRFVQVVLADVRSLSSTDVPTKVDLELARARVRDPDVYTFLERWPFIMPAKAYDEPPGFEARQAWANLMAHKPWYTYKRSTHGIYKNDAFNGSTEVPAGENWCIELEPCLHNVLSVCRHIFGVDLPALAAVEQPWCNSLGEGHSTDVSGEAQGHMDEACRQLSRPRLHLQARVSPPDTYYAHHYVVNIDLAVNRLSAWRWVLSRRLLHVVPPYDDKCTLSADGRPLIATSEHSHIEEYELPRHGKWDWISAAS